MWMAPKVVNEFHWLNDLCQYKYTLASLFGKYKVATSNVYLHKLHNYHPKI